MVKRGSVILLIAILTISGLSGCNREERYEWQGHNWKDMLSLFEEQKPIFTEIADIFSTNESFWEQCRQYEEDSSASIMSPYDVEIEVFSDSEQEIITAFFERTHPYSISVRSQEYITIHYINEERTSGFSLAFYYGDNLDGWLRAINGQYSVFIDLGNNWFFINYEKNSL